MVIIMSTNKIVIAAAVASAFLASSTVLAASGDKHYSQGTVNWTGTANIIPSDAHTITGENGILRLDDGSLSIKADGTFVSTPIVMESHMLEPAPASGPVPALQDRVKDKVATDWTLDNASLDWGVDNTAAVAAADLVFTDQISGTTFTVGGGETVKADTIKMSVSNNTALTGIVNPAAEARVEATFISTYIEP